MTRNNLVPRQPLALLLSLGFSCLLGGGSFGLPLRRLPVLTTLPNGQWPKALAKRGVPDIFEEDGVVHQEAFPPHSSGVTCSHLWE